MIIQRISYIKAIDQESKSHPAPFPYDLAKDHILSWSNENDIVLDPMCGSGTTCVAAFDNNRNYIGIDICEEYCELATKRMKIHEDNLGMFYYPTQERTIAGSSTSF